MKLAVKNIKGEEVDTLTVADSLFDAPMNAALLHQAMVMYQANSRQGTHDTKTRSEVAGGGRKPWRQKHTGRARHGSIRAPQWRHGGVVFGPHPRDHRLQMPRKMRHQALRCALSEKARRDKLVVVDSIELTEAKTKEMIEALKALEVKGSTLLVTNGKDEAAVRSSRNLSRVYTLPVNLLNAEVLLHRETVVMTVDAVKKAEELWAMEAAPSETAEEQV